MATGHIRKRIGKTKVTYEVIIETGSRDPVTGKRQRIYKTYKQKKDAVKALNETVHSLNHGCYADAHNMSFSTLADKWAESKKYNLKESTKSRYMQQLEWYILPKIGKYPVDCLGADILQKYINEIYQNPPTVKNRGKPLSPKTIRNIYFNLKSIFDYAVTLKLLSSNPCKDVVLPKIEKPDVQSFSEEEIKKILTCAKDTDLFFPIYLLLNTGMRRGELLGLRWKDVHIDDSGNNTIDIVQTRISVAGKEVIDTPKSRSSKRTIQLSSAAKDRFLDYRLWCRKVLLRRGKSISPDDYVIIRSDGTTDSPDNFSKRWRVFLKKNNIRPLKLHCLRHTCATMLLKGNIDVKTISSRLGHADTNLVLNTYGHTLDSMSQKAADMIDEIINAS